MATAYSSSSIESSSRLSDHCIRLSQPPYELHKAVFNGEVRTVRRLIQQGPDCVNATDCHGDHLLILTVQLLLRYNH